MFMGYFNATLVRIAISEVLRSKAEQNLRGGFREAAAGYSVLYDIHVFLLLASGEPLLKMNLIFVFSFWASGRGVRGEFPKPKTPYTTSYLPSSPDLNNPK